MCGYPTVRPPSLPFPSQKLAEGGHLPKGCPRRGRSDLSYLFWTPVHLLFNHHSSGPATPLTDGQEIPGSSWMPADLSPPSIPYHVSSLPALPVTLTDPPWQTVNRPTAGISTQSTSSSPAHSPFRDTPTPINQSDGGSKGKKRSRGRYRKEDPADRYLRENMEDGGRLWTCLWVEPSHGTPDPPAAQNICGHQAPKSNARQHVKSRHLKLRYVNLLSLLLARSKNLNSRAVVPSYK